MMLAVSRSRLSAPYGANLLFNQPSPGTPITDVLTAAVQHSYQISDARPYNTTYITRTSTPTRYIKM